MKSREIKLILHCLRGVKFAQPDSYFKIMARRRILAVLEKDQVRKPMFGFLSVPIFASPAFRVAFAVLLVFVFVGSGTVLAAQSSLPGDKLYGLKTASENVVLKLSPAFLKPTIDQKINARRQEEISELESQGRNEEAEKMREKIKSLKSTPNPEQLKPKTKPTPVPKRKPDSQKTPDQPKEKPKKEEGEQPNPHKKNPPKNHQKSKNAFLLLSRSLPYPASNFLVNASF